MNRLEIQGYVQIVIGIVGILATMLTAPALLDALGQVGINGQLPREFAGISGAIRIFSVLLVLFVFILLIVLGLATTLSTLVKGLGANHPFLVSMATICGVVALSVTVMLAALGSTFWVAGFIGSLGLGIISIVACADNEKFDLVSGWAIALLILFLITGGITVLANSMPTQNAQLPITVTGAITPKLSAPPRLRAKQKPPNPL